MKGTVYLYEVSHPDGDGAQHWAGQRHGRGCPALGRA